MWIASTLLLRHAILCCMIFFIVALWASDIIAHAQLLYKQQPGIHADRPPWPMFMRRRTATSQRIGSTSRTSNASSTALSPRPHIIFILADDLGWNDVSFHGSKQIPTPNIDALAAAGIVLNNYYVAPICTPSRGALMTGKYPSHLGLQHDVIAMDQPWGLSLNETLLPQHLRRLGYRRHIVGKWHLGMHKAAYTPTFRGFETHLGYWGGYIDYYDHTSETQGPASPNIVLRGHDFYRNMEPAFDTKGRYATDVFTEHALNIIHHHNVREPLCLYMSHLAVHAGLRSNPLQAPWKLVKDFMHIKDPHRKVFAAMTYALDESVGKLVNALERKGMLDNAIIVFSTDNGGAAGGINRNAASNWPLKGTKYTAWEGGVRGVGLVWSKHLGSSAHATSNHLMHMVDWLPTLYFAAGGSVKDLGSIDGVNMWPTLVDNHPESPRNELLLDLDPLYQKSAIRVNHWKLVNGTWDGGAYDKWFGPTGLEDAPFGVHAKDITTSTYFTDSHSRPAPSVVPIANLILDADKTKRQHRSNREENQETRIGARLRHRRLIDRRRQRASKMMAKAVFNSDVLQVDSSRLQQPILNVSALISPQRRRLFLLENKAAIDCGPMPNASDPNYVSCDPVKAPCLFDISTDPCEYWNKAEDRPDIVETLWRRIMEYQASSVRPKNEPGDPKADPKLWGYLWTNWKDFV